MKATQELVEDFRSFLCFLPRVSEMDDSLGVIDSKQRPAERSRMAEWRLFVAKFIRNRQ